jgi:transcriptional regulator with XRE-family HTH domain/tetratricopeptide (TPR) repeat protein
MPEKLGARNDLALALTVMRVLAGIEQEDLATASGVSYSSIQKIEQGRRRPTAKSLAAIVAALRVDLRTLEALKVIIREIRGGPPADRPPLAGAPAGVGRGEAAYLSAAGALHLPRRRAGGGARVAPSLEESRRRAPQLWARFARYSHAVRRALIVEGPEFQDAGLCELLCELSVQAAGNDARRALRLAELAVLVGERVPGPEGWRRRVEGYARFHLTNGLRVGGKFQAAGEALARAAELWQAGAADDPGLLNEARVLEIEASLRRDQGEPAQALALLDQALAADHWGETPSLLLNKARALEELSDFAGSIALLRKASAHIDRDREPRKLFLAHLNMAVLLCKLGRHAEAEQALPEIRALARCLGNQLDDLRVGWLEAKSAAGLDRTAEAVAAFERVRAGFAEQGIAYDAALVTLELAELHAALGQTAEVKRLARESAPIFHQEGVHREAQRALDLFQRAADEELVTVELVRGVLAYLERARRDPQLRYQPTS